MIVGLNPTSAEQISEFISGLEDDRQQALVTALALEDESWNKNGCLKLLHNYVDTRQQIRSNERLEEQILAAEKNNDQDRLLALLSQKQKQAESREKRKMDMLGDK
jgi:DNA primase